VSARIALVTGGSSGIGEALAHRLRARGYELLLSARGRDRLVAAADTMGAQALPGDICDPADRHALVEAVRARGRIDLLVNNAGAGGGTTGLDIDPARARRVLEINFYAHLALTQALWPLLVEARAVIVNVSSVYGTYAADGSAGYCASKHALTAWSRALTAAARPLGVRVLTVNPGPVATTTFRHDELLADPLRRRLVLDAGQCADDVLRALDRGRSEIWTRGIFRLPALAQALAPGTFTRLLAGRL
jgi:short-subunit dehydrogenase